MKLINMAISNLRIVQLSLTNRCQCNCEHCGVSFFKNKKEETLTISEIDSIFKELKLIGGTVVDLFGGEPTLRKDIFDIIKLGRSYGLYMVIESNGGLLNEDFIKKLKKAGLNQIYLSLDDYEAKKHDQRRRLDGLFDKVIEAIALCNKYKIKIHISTVPKNKEYFISGDMNRFVKFCLEKGAEKVRILFPSCTGNWSLERKNSMSKEEEEEIFKYVDIDLLDKMYVEVENNSPGEETICSAKTMFCHIMANGLVMPCPYLPFVFGNAKKESMAVIFARIQNHPYLKKNGNYCPSRDKKFLTEYLGDISITNPYKLINSKNKIDIGSQCNNNCNDCHLFNKEFKQIIQEISEIDRDYDSIDLFGGEIFLKKNIFKILDSIPKKFKINFYTNARIFIYPEIFSKINKYNIQSIKVPFFSFDKAEFDDHTRIKNSFKQTIKGIQNLTRRGFIVCLYVPKHKYYENVDFFNLLQIATVSTYEEIKTKDKKAEILQDSVLCFGKKIKSEKLVWVKK